MVWSFQEHLFGLLLLKNLLLLKGLGKIPIFVAVYFLIIIQIWKCLIFCIQLALFCKVLIQILFWEQTRFIRLILCHPCAAAFLWFKLSFLKLFFIVLRTSFQFKLRISSVSIRLIYLLFSKRQLQIFLLKLFKVFILNNISWVYCMLRFSFHFQIILRRLWTKLTLHNEEMIRSCILSRFLFWFLLFRTEHSERQSLIK